MRCSPSASRVPPPTLPVVIGVDEQMDELGPLDHHMADRLVGVTDRHHDRLVGVGRDALAPESSSLVHVHRFDKRQHLGWHEPAKRHLPATDKVVGDRVGIVETGRSESIR